MKKILSILISIVLSFFASFIFLQTNTTASRSSEYHKFLSRTNADLIVFYNNESSFDNDFYYMNRIYSAYYKNDKMPLDILMIKNEVNYTFFNNLSLNENEVAISKNVAERYRIKIGDKIVNKNALSSEDDYYTVKDYVDSSYSISVDYFSENTGLIIFGYNDSVIGDNFESVAFLKNDDSINSVHVNKIISIKKIKSDLNYYSIRAFSLNLLAQITMSVIIVFGLLIKDLPLIRKDIILGFNKRELLKRYCFPYFLYSASSVISYLVILNILNVVINHVYSFEFINLFGLAIPIVIAITQFVLVELKIRRV